MKGVFLHVLADALGSVVVIISALIIWLTDWEYKMYVDPCLSVALVGLIMVIPISNRPLSINRLINGIHNCRCRRGHYVSHLF